MKLTKIEKLILKEEIAELLEYGGFIHIYHGGITRVYKPVSTSKNNRMYWYGQSVCNASDKYKKKIGIMLALEDLNCSDKIIPIEMIYALAESRHLVESIG